LCIGSKTTAPEFHGSILFKSNTVYRYHRNSVRNGVRTLDSLPSVILVLVGFFILVSRPTDRSRVEHDFCSHKRSNPGSFWVPLSQTHQYANFTKFCAEYFVT